MFSFTFFLGKIKIKGDFKGSHKKTDRAFKNSRAMNHTSVSTLKEKREIHYEGQEDTGIPNGIG